jgi:ABC-2 type transport system permease protein
MIGALVYLASRSAQNRLARQIRRLRTPRYFIAIVLGLLYLYAIIEQQRSARSGASPESARWVDLVVTVGIACAAAWAWIFGSERRALAFSPADVTFLFSGPVTRRGLVSYKLLRAQLVVLFNTLLWTLLLTREHFGASPWLRALSLWVLLTTLSMHRIGASFVRSSLIEYGATGARHRLISLLAAVIGIPILVWTLWRAVPDLLAALRAGGPDSLFAALSAVTHQPPLAWLLVPVQLVVRPLTAPTATAWLAAIVPAVGILVLHVIWVIQSDAAFEEAALQHTLARARRETINERAGSVPSRLATRRLPRWLHLRPTGWPAGAILWKNLVAAFRARRVWRVLAAGLVAGIVSALLSFGSGASVSDLAGSLALIWAVLMLLVGPQWIRNDLRADLPRFDLLRSYPIPGPSLVAAEVAGSAIVLTAIQLALLGFAYLAFLGDRNSPLTFQERSLALVAALVYLPPVNYIGMLIQNGGAVLFPAWVHSGPERAGGVEALGQNMLLIIVHAGALGVLIALPATTAVGLHFLLQPTIGGWAEVFGAVAALSILAIEAQVLVRRLGATLERTDPTAIEV